MGEDKFQLEIPWERVNSSWKFPWKKVNLSWKFHGWSIKRGSSTGGADKNCNSPIKFHCGSTGCSFETKLLLSISGTLIFWVHMPQPIRNLVTKVVTNYNNNTTFLTIQCPHLITPSRLCLPTHIFNVLSSICFAHHGLTQITLLI